MKRKFICAIGDSLYEGSVTPTETVVECCKYDNKWTKLAFSKTPVRISDDGNGLDVYFSDGKTIRLDYSQAVELRLALHLNATTSGKPATLKKWEG